MKLVATNHKHSSAQQQQQGGIKGGWDASHQETIRHVSGYCSPLHLTRCETLVLVPLLQDP